MSYARLPLLKELWLTESTVSTYPIADGPNSPSLWRSLTLGFGVSGDIYMSDETSWTTHSWAWWTYARPVKRLHSFVRIAANVTSMCHNVVGSKEVKQLQEKNDIPPGLLPITHPAALLRLLCCLLRSADLNYAAPLRHRFMYLIVVRTSLPYGK